MVLPWRSCVPLPVPPLTDKQGLGVQITVLMVEDHVAKPKPSMRSLLASGGRVGAERLRPALSEASRAKREARALIY